MHIPPGAGESAAPVRRRAPRGRPALRRDRYDPIRTCFALPAAFGTLLCLLPGGTAGHTTAGGELKLDKERDAAAFFWPFNHGAR